LSGRHGPTVMTLLSTTVKLLPPNYVRWRSKRTKSSTSTANCTFLLLAILRRVYPLQGTTKEACHLFIAGIWTLGLPAASLSRRVSGFLRFFCVSSFQFDVSSRHETISVIACVGYSAREQFSSVFFFFLLLCYS
jgi:hypothetical protein